MLRHLRISQSYTFSITSKIYREFLGEVLLFQNGVVCDLKFKIWGFLSIDIIFKSMDVDSERTPCRLVLSFIIEGLLQSALKSTV